MTITLYNSAGPLDAIESNSEKNARQELARRLNRGDWLLSPGDRIEITEY